MAQTRIYPIEFEKNLHWHLVLYLYKTQSPLSTRLRLRHDYKNKYELINHQIQIRHYLLQIKSLLDVHYYWFIYYVAIQITW